MHSHNTTLAAARILNGDLGLCSRRRDDDLAAARPQLGLPHARPVACSPAPRRCCSTASPRAAALDLIARERVTYIPTAPASLTAILQQPDLDRRDLSSLKFVVSGGASAPVETIRAWRRAAPGVLLELLGMLETGYQAYTRPTDDPERVAGSVGVPASHMGLRLIDAEGRDVPPGQEGEICCDGPSVHLGYHNNPERQRGRVPARRLVPQRRSRCDRPGRAPAHRRPPQGDDQPRRQEVLSARDRGDPLYPSAGALCRDRRHSGSAAGRAQLPLPGAASRRGADARSASSPSSATASPPTSCPSGWSCSGNSRSPRPARSSATRSCARCWRGCRPPTDADDLESDPWTNAMHAFRGC